MHKFHKLVPAIINWVIPQSVVELLHDWLRIVEMDKR